MPGSCITAALQDLKPRMSSAAAQMEPGEKALSGRKNTATDSRALPRLLSLFTGDMRVCGDWMKKQVLGVQMVDWVFRGIAQVMFVNNPLSGLLIAVGLILQNRWHALNGLLGTLLSTTSALLIGQSRGGVSAGLHGYNGTLVGMLMAVFSASGDWCWWLLLPNTFMSMMCPVVSSALASVFSKWDLPVFTLPFNMVLYVHMAATGPNHPFFPQVVIPPKSLSHDNTTGTELSISELVLSVPVGVGQVYGCDGPWTGGLFILALLVSSPTICLHAILGSAAGSLAGLALAAPRQEIYSGLWGYNSALSCIAIGGMFYALTWQAHLLAITCAFFCAYLGSAFANVVSVWGLPACTWPFCLSTLTFLLLSSGIRALLRLPLSAVSYPEENRRFYRNLRDSEGCVENRQDDRPQNQQSVSNEATLMEEDGDCRPNVIVT
ncbi:urea transporter 1-like isoform X1 [Osmerus mordax]|uniref:urea transporter 1-like isoform X1 n=1 Tax=Osmerus mordax TaxID=8014 RepID=UPI00350FDC89